MTPNAADLEVLEPSLQVSFYYRLQTLRGVYLQEALGSTVDRLDVAALDRELRRYVGRRAMRRVATFGIRGEVFFPVPLVLRTNPFLLGYYRLLLGFSQKEFFTKGPFGRFKALEDAGRIPARAEGDLPALCRSLARSAEMLVERLDELSPSVIHDLQLLTLGPQLRGSRNTRVGQDATEQIVTLIREVLRHRIEEETDTTLIVKNDSGRRVLVEFFSDPDVSITETMQSGVRPVVSVEIKGGADASNVHNRLGEAEKSHLKARGKGFNEFWTIMRVELDAEVARRDSPTTTRFFHLERITDSSSTEHARFVDLLTSMIGVAVDPRPV